MLEKRVELLLDLVDTTGTMVNVGCGANPELHRLLKDRAKHLIGIDIDEQKIGQMQADGFDARLMNAEQMNTEPADCIVAGEVIEHLSNPGCFLAAAAGCLKPGGRLIITTPNISSVFLLFLVIICEQSQDPTHVCHFDRPNLMALLGRCKEFTVKRLFYAPPSIKMLGRGIMRPVFLIATILANIGFLMSKRLCGSYIVVLLERNP